MTSPDTLQIRCEMSVPPPKASMSSACVMRKINPIYYRTSQVHLVGDLNEKFRQNVQMPKKRSDSERIYGKRLEAVRLALGFDKIRSFAEALDIHEDTYRAWERGDNMVPPSAITVLFDLYGVDHNWIYLGDPSRLPYALASAMPANLFREPRKLAPAPPIRKRA